MVLPVLQAPPGGAAAAAAAAPQGWLSGIAGLIGAPMRFATASTIDLTSARLEGVSHAAITDAVASLGALLATAPTKLVEGTEIAFIKKLANLATTIVDGARSSLPAERPLSPMIAALFAANEQLKAAVANEASSLEELTTASTRVIDLLGESETFIQDICLGTPATTAAPDLEAIDLAMRGPVPALAPPDPAPINLNAALSQSLLDLTLRIERRAQLTAVFGQQIPATLLTHIGDPAPTYRDHYNQALTQHLSTRSSLIRPFARLYLNIISFFTGIVLDYFCQKLQASLTQALQDFSNAETDSMMNFFADIVVDGLKLYSEEIINSALSIRNETHAAGANPEGTFDERLAANLEGKKSLRGGCATPQDFYYKIFDLILAKALNGSIVRKIILYVARKMHFLDDPFMSIPTSIRDTNGYHYALDKAIVAFVNPLLAKMAEAEVEAEAPAAGVEPAAEAAPAPKKSKAYSRATQENLRKALTSLYLATDITKVANVNDLERLLERQSRKDHSMLSKEYILVETAEAAALTLLETMNELLNRDFVMKQMIEAIHVMNNSFTPDDAVTEDQRRDAERERVDALNRLTSAMIGSALENAPIINADKTHAKMNALLGQIHTQALSLQRLLTKLQNYGPQGPAGKLVNLAGGGGAAAGVGAAAGAPETTPYEDWRQIFEAIRRIENTLKEHEEIGSLSESQLSVLAAALAAYKNDLSVLTKVEGGAGLCFNDPPPRASVRGLAAAPGAPVPSLGTRLEAGPFQAAIAASLATVNERLLGEIYAPKALIGILSHPKLKRIAKIGVTLLLKDQFNKVYDFACQSMTVKNLFLNQSLAALLGRRA